MHQLLEEINKTNGYIDNKGKRVDVLYETSYDQCKFITNIIKENGFKNGIESGLAFGVSALAITEAVAANGGRHCAVDVFQTSNYFGLGVKLVEQAGYKDKFELIEDYGYKAFPKLYLEGRKFDFAYIDATKMVDHVLVDFFFIDKILQEGGVIVFDDLQFVGIRKILRYIVQLPHYKIYAQYPDNYFIPITRIAKTMKKFSRTSKLLKEEIYKTDYDLGVNCAAIAIQKLGEDQRRWDWHMAF